MRVRGTEGSSGRFPISLTFCGFPRVRGDYSSAGLSREVLSLGLLLSLREDVGRNFAEFPDQANP